MVVKVYGPAKAACPQRVLACLFELGIEFDLIPLDLEAMEQKNPDFLLRQPFGQVPAIEDGEFRLFESRAIIRYYAAKSALAGGLNLVGDTLEEKALVDQWLDVEAQNYNPLIYTMVLQLLILPQIGLGGDMNLVEECKDKVEKVLDVYEERLSKSKYLAGEKFTIADLSHLSNTKFLLGHGMEDLITKRKHVHAWWMDISTRPAWKKVMELQH